MAKAEMSAGFGKFAAKTTKGAFDEARKGERMGMGIPLDIGTEGEAVVSYIICDESKADKEGVKHPRIRVELKILTPEGAKGKTLTGSGLIQTIKDGNDPSKWSAEDAWGAALGMLEKLGCPEEITKGYKDFNEVLDFFTDEARKVSYKIVDASYERNGKTVAQKGVDAYAFIEQGVHGSAVPPQKERDPNATYVIYRGALHKVLEDHGDTYDLESVNGDRTRQGINKDDTTPE